MTLCAPWPGKLASYLTTQTEWQSPCHRHRYVVNKSSMANAREAQSIQPKTASRLNIPRASKSERCQPIFPLERNVHSVPGNLIPFPFIPFLIEDGRIESYHR